MATQTVQHMRQYARQHAHFPLEQYLGTAVAGARDETVMRACTP